ncbi:hypothetical protein BDA99DRAFT_539083 [Phascolomyces articulosus]|uniref:C2H2-type domain-containing protein n=1 Tax=Phascolomyces articulosus TaxID=60185 RepID=A0AAD5JWV7_9FUNG|nr:hypothetical protein BDA99DRAFT_539083 [Phascolomyces articulosus]
MPKVKRKTTSNNNFECKQCNIKFSRPRDLKRHYRSTKAHKTDPTNLGHPCPVCHKQFTRHDVMMNHQGNRSCIHRLLYQDMQFFCNSDGKMIMVPLIFFQGWCIEHAVNDCS